MKQPMRKSNRSIKLFDLNKRVVVITGGAGFLGKKHAEAVAELGGIPVLFDIQTDQLKDYAETIKKKFSVDLEYFKVDITSSLQVETVTKKLLGKYKKIDVLINNAANNKTVKADKRNSMEQSRLENFSLEQWDKDLSVGLTGAFLCSQIIGREMAKLGRGVIINIASDLGLIAPDQRLYRHNDLPVHRQPVKPVSYSAVKHGLIGLTRYLATYWADQGIRVNALCPGGIEVLAPDQKFVQRLSQLIPMGRMASPDEYKGAIQFLCSDASAYMTGQCLVMDGGRTCW